ncbi:unnamed protein product [Zymoseptoria tritici ST99CH_3D1]|nr:unnamed protein product [Zymoseptoria tritici ST99CH_3D1]
MDDSHRNSEMADLEPAERARLTKLGRLVTNHFTKHRALLPDPAKDKPKKRRETPTAMRCMNDAVRLWALAGPLNSGDGPEAKAK